MKYKLILPILLLLLYVAQAQAQQVTKTCSVHFKVDEFTLDPDDEAVLSEMTAAALPATYYEIEITAHTDNDADNGYNISLSNKRATSVKTFLLNQKLNNNFIRSAAFGESKPKVANKNSENKAINRRVDLTLKAFSANSIGDLLKQAAPEYKQTFTIDATKDNTIKGRNGTVIFIPANSLLTANGTVATGVVNIELEEYLKPTDAAFNQLSTVSNGQMLETGGMFKIAAKANGQALSLMQGANLKVDMPTINMRNGMNLFTEVKNTNGVSEWKQTTTEFRPKNEVRKPLPFVKLDTKYLNTLLANNIAEKQSFEKIYKLANLPQKPSKIGKAPVLRELNIKNQFAWWERLIYTDKYLNKKLDTERTRRQKTYDKLMTAYIKKKVKFDINMAKYIDDSTNFEANEKAQLFDWLSKAKQASLANIEVLEKVQWNEGIKRMIYKSDGNELTMLDIKGCFYASIYKNYGVRLEINNLHNIVELIDKFNNMSISKIYELCGHKKEINFDVYFQKHYFNNANSNQFANAQIMNNPKLNQMLLKAEDELITLRDKDKIFDEKGVGNIYTVALSGFGTFNCDRFSNTPKNQMATIKIPFKESANVSVFVPSINSYMYANRTMEGYEVEIPKDLEVKVIFVALNKENGPLVQIHKTKFGKNTVFTPKPVAVNLKTMKQMLASI